MSQLNHPVQRNPYEAPQAIFRTTSQSCWSQFLKRTAIGFFVGATLYTAVHLLGDRINSGSEFARGLFIAGLCPLVAGTSLFTQTKMSRGKSDTGIIPACFLCFVALVLGWILRNQIHLITIPTEPTRGEHHELWLNATLLAYIIYLGLIAFYFSLFKLTLPPQKLMEE